MRNIDISIIISIYNIESYIKRCVDSVLNQTFKGIEILLIDDGSDDGSAEICDYYASTYDFIKAFHLQNGGPSLARNYGIKNAKGKYICFFDGDDFISKTYLEILYNNMNKNNLDILVSNFVIYPKMEISKHFFVPNKVLTGKELINSNSKIHTNNDLIACWRMIYRTEFIKRNNLIFNGKIFYGEDTEFNIRAMALADRAMAISEVGYYYETSRNMSLMRASKKLMYDVSLVEQYKMRKNIYGLNKQYDRDLYRYYIEHIFWSMVKNESTANRIDQRYIKTILQYDMFRDAKKFFGLFYKTKNKMEYILYILMYFDCSRILAFVWNR